MVNHPQRYVLMNRDGVIHRRLFSREVLSWNDVEFLPRALDALRLLAEHGFGVLVVSHQQCVSNGQVTPVQLQRLTQRMLLEVALRGGTIDKVYYCLHHQNSSCQCRPPAAGLFRRALAEHHLRASETFVISDSPQYLSAAASLGCPQIHLQRDAFLSNAPEDNDQQGLASNLYEAAEHLITRMAGEENVSTRNSPPLRISNVAGFFHHGYIRPI